MNGSEPKMTTVKVEGQADRQELTFETPEMREAFGKAVGDYLNEEVKFKAYTVSVDELEGIDNLTPSILSTMEKYGIIK